MPLHEPAHVAKLADTEQLSQGELDRMGDRFNSVFLCPESYDCALLAAGCVLEVRTAESDGGTAGREGICGDPATCVTRADLCHPVTRVRRLSGEGEDQTGPGRLNFRTD